jgi:hypothetical protein
VADLPFTSAGESLSLKRKPSDTSLFELLCDCDILTIELVKRLSRKALGKAFGKALGKALGKSLGKAVLE